MLSDEIQLGYALEAFGWAHQKGQGWATSKLLCFKSAGISTMSLLEIGCKEKTVNMDMELFGVPQEQHLSDKTMEALQIFLPGPVGFRCFRLAQKAAAKVKKGTAATEYVHRLEDGKSGREEWDLPVGEEWTLNVDCAGFVRNTLKHVTKNRLVMALSDRDFMRAKDFYAFFQTVPYTVMDQQEICEETKYMKWRIVPDLRMIIPGDVIVYRPKGNAAGGAAFTINDRKDIGRLLKAVKTSQLWSKGEWGNHVTVNVAKDARVKGWVQETKKILSAVGITTVKHLKTNIDSLNDLLAQHDFELLDSDTLFLMKECVETTAMNTGHIVFASGPAVDMGKGEYRIRVVHSTKYGYKDDNGQVTTGVQEYFRRFSMVENADGTIGWTREMKKAEPIDIGPDAVIDDDENPNDDMEDDEDENENGDEGEDPTDELSGQGDVQVIAARMCF